MTNVTLISASLITEVYTNLVTYVFGSTWITTLMLYLLFFTIGMLIRIPLIVNLGILIPISIIFMAVGVLPVLAGTLIVVLVMVLMGFAIASQM